MKLKKLLSIGLLAVLLLQTAACASASAPPAESDGGATTVETVAPAFTDVPADAWYAQAVLYCQERGLIGGTTADSFSPDRSMTRSMLAAVLYRLAGSPAVSTAPGFSDTQAGAWYADAVTWAAEAGVVSGYGNGLFGTNDAVNREQTVTTLWRYANSPESGATAAFTDTGDLSVWARSAANWAWAQRIAAGREGNRFAPKETITRAEVCVMLHRWLNLSNSGAPTATPSPEITLPPDGGIAFDFDSKTVTLNSGYEMPINGLGTYSLTGETCVASVTAALERGVRLIDTAHIYGNEAEVGQAVRDSGIPREEIFVITKLYPNQFAGAEDAIDEALQKLDIGYIDLMLLHHPGANDVEAYSAMERAVAAGKVRSIGLSNWYVEELEEFLPQVTIPPALVQNEIHPYYQENDVIPYIQSLRIVVQGWYPFGGRGHTAELLGNEVINEIAADHNKSAAQVILRWNLQKGVVVIPGSSNPDHIQENTELYDFELTDGEMARINALNRGEKHDWY
ncbi:aldo/keto reductase [Butyricicoccus faecihominis]|uniref:aldo/keto reductase n=1 Tax=Butyricicoccus faecihominis TaxID=1712515 RepID=UPI00247A5598|nr:aldo/keto reductase [Butyricicoccus faecihominis]MCQ5128397.1 aldo/keto reductase [Butyricicoccus faecihominis]